MPCQGLEPETSGLGSECATRGGGATPKGDQVYVCPLGNRKNQENFALVIGKNKKTFEILPLKRVKFEIFARVIG